MKLHHWLLLSFSAVFGLALGVWIQHGQQARDEADPDAVAADIAAEQREGDGEVVAEVGDAPAGEGLEGDSATANDSADEAQTAGDVLTDDSVVGASRPGFTMPDLDGESIDVARFDGDILIINFWATWCPPCVEEIPMLIELQEDLADDGVRVFGVAVEEPEPVRDFAAEFGIDYPLVADRRQGFDVAADYGNPEGLMPYTVFIDREGTIRGVHQGLLTREQAEEHLQAMPDGP